MKNRPWLTVMGHTKMVAVTGILVSALILILMPALNWIAEITLGVVLIHIALLLVLSLSAAVVLPEKVKQRLRSLIHGQQESSKFNAGWSVGWRNGFWVASVVLLAASVHVWLSFPELPLLALFIFLLSVNLFIGSLIIRAPQNNEYLVFPMVKLFPEGSQNILDAGCGAGRSTVALSKVYSGKITSFDLFDSDYIEGGGNTLLEKNLKITGISGQVEIVQGDITRTSFADSSFDAAVSSYMIDHLGDQKLNALREINRILKPGGRMLMIVLTRGLSSFALLSVLSLFMTGKSRWTKLFKEADFKLVESGEVNGGTYYLIEK
jgi:SAM-dependent methyltransferase